MDLGDPPQKSKKSNFKKSNSKKSEVSSEEEDKLKAYVVMSKTPSCIGSNSAYCMEISNSSKTLSSQAERFGVQMEDIFNVNYRSETSAMAAETWFKSQPHIPEPSFFAHRDFFTGLTIPESLTKQLQTLCHALQIQYNHTLPYNTAAMYGVSLNTHNINRYFEGVIGVMPTFKYGNISFGDFDFVILKPRFFIPPNNWKICSIPLGPRTKMKEDRKDSNLYRLSDFLPLFSNHDATTMKRGLLEKIDRARELQITKISEQIEELKRDNKKNKNNARIKEISDIIKLWEADIGRFSKSAVANEILEDENVGKLRKIMCELTLDRIEPLLVEDEINIKRFNVLKESVKKMGNDTASNTKITIPYVDSGTKTEKTEQVEIKDVDIEITQPSSLKSMAIVCNEVLLVGPNSRFNEAISAVYGNRPSQYPHHLYPGDSHIGKPLKPHKPVLIEIDYKNIDENHLLDALVDKIEGESISTKERLRESFFLKLLEHGFVYKVEENGNKLEVHNIPRASAIALGDIALASRSLSGLDPTHSYGHMAERGRASSVAERNRESFMDEGSSPPDAVVLADSQFPVGRLPVFETHERRARANARGDLAESLTPSPPSSKHISSKNKLRFRDKPPPQPYMPAYDRKKLLDADPLLGQMALSKKLRKENRAEQIAKKREKKSKSRSPDNTAGGKRKTRKNRH